MRLDVDKKVKLRDIVDIFFIMALPFICVSGLSPLPWMIRTPVIYFVGFVAAIYAILTNINIRLNTITFLFFVFWLYIAISVTYSYDAKNTLHYVYIYLAMFPILFIDFSDRVWEKIMDIMLIYAVVIAVSIVISVPIENCMDRFFWFIVNPSHDPVVSDWIKYEVSKNSYAGFAREIASAAFIMNVGIAVQFSKFFSNSEDFKAKDIAIFILLIIALLLTGKRMMLFIVALAFCGLMLISDIKGKAGKNVVIGFTAALSILMILMFIPSLANTFLRFTDSENMASMGQRDVLWSYSYMLMEKFWVFGAGFSSYNSYAYDHGMRSGGQRWDYHNHNIYYQAIGEIGVVGCIFFFGFLLVALIRTLVILRSKKLDQVQKKLLNFSFYIQLMLMIYGISGNPIYNEEIMYTWMIAIGMYMCVSARISEKRRKEFGYRRMKKRLSKEA